MPYSQRTIGLQASDKVASLTAATYTLTPQDYEGRILLFDKADGVTVTLPAATGTGDVYRFLVKTATTSNGYIVKVANATDVMVGRVWMADDTGTPAPLVWVAAATSDTVTLDGSTKGGIAGDYIELTDYASGKWFIQGDVKGSGSEATPFSATVS